MYIKDRFTTSSMEHLWSLVRVHELGEFTSNGQGPKCYEGTPPEIEA
jgi:predicted FMN-binding regulatory protein PaiB